jgi:hypothetical protein
MTAGHKSLKAGASATGATSLMLEDVATGDVPDVHATARYSGKPCRAYLDSALRLDIGSHHDVHVHILPADLNG